MTQPDEQATPVCAADGCARPADPIICGKHADDLGQHLAQLGAEYELLSAVPSMQGREVGTIGGSTLAAQRSVGNTHVMALRDRRAVTAPFTEPDPWGLDDTPSVYATLHSYAELVRDGRGLTRPRLDLAYVRAARPAGPVCDPDGPRCGHHTCEVWTFRANVADRLTVASERALLAERNNLRWLLLQEWAGEFADEMAALWRRLRSATAGPSSDRKPPVGRCTNMRGEHECGGLLWADETATQVTCGACGHAYDQDDLRRLGDELLREGYVLVERAAWYTDVPAGTIRRWVSEGRITSEKQGRRLCVNIGEVEQVRDTRKVAQRAS